MQSMKEITLRNDFHDSTARVRVTALPARLTPRQTARAANKLCGIPGCHCGIIRGMQDVFIDDHFDQQGTHSWVISEGN